MRKKAEFSYDSKVGRWWLARSLDGAHRRAYRNIADFIRDSFAREPRLIVDYACGPGNLLSLLSLRFRNSKLVGLDGSAFQLGVARRRFARLPVERAERVTLIETALPNPDILPGKADLVVYCFPNMVPYPGQNNAQEFRDCLTEGDRRIARSLLIDSDPDDENGKMAENVSERNALVQGRCISLNLRRLLARDGICIRIEYATMQRHELSPLELEYVSFEEGSLDTKVEGRMPGHWFRLLASAYFRSRVLDDVYEQTGDERDKNGGYLITVLRAI
jgi:SAM-dependent methyltransferase